MTGSSFHARLEVSPGAGEHDTVEDGRSARAMVGLARREFLFLMLEADRPGAGAARYELDDVDEVVIGRGMERSAIRRRVGESTRLTIELPAPSLSRVHARLYRTIDGWTIEDVGSTNGTFLGGKRVARALLGADAVVEIGHCLLRVRDFFVPSSQPFGDLDSGQMTSTPPGFRTLLPDLCQQLDELRRIAESTLSVVLTGESGTGKEVLARGIHALSRRTGPFLAVNCGALTETLVESQLFGHVRGAFTGALADALGYVRAAAGGTLLLDEIGDLNRVGQVALLRVLQEREVVPVGSARPQSVDVRIICASSRPLDQLVNAGLFRADLLARLSGFSHATSPLRNRIEDLGLLVAALVNKSGIKAQASAISPEVGWRLLRHRWPLNVRELEQALLRGWALAADGVIDAAHLRLEDGGTTPAPTRPPVLSPADAELRARLVAELTATRGVVSEVARRLGKARMQVHRWMKRVRLDPGTFRR